MKILFLIYHGFSESSGISKKIRYQIKGLQENGHEIHTCTYIVRKDKHRVRMIDDNPLQDFGTGKLASFKKRVSYKSLINYVIKNKFDFIYARSFHNANPFTINMFRTFKNQGIASVIEIPTYPYDQEYIGFPLATRIGIKIDKLFRKQLAAQTNGIVTFTADKQIFGKHTIQISNGIDFDYIPLRVPSLSSTKNIIQLIGVAEVHYWHGFDRLIHGLGEYYNSPHTKEVIFHIVGGVGPSEMYKSVHAEGFHELIKKYSIQDKIIFHGQKFGSELDALFNFADFAIGSLARHRSGITHIKTLKNREYAARGIPFIYSEIDEDFEDKSYIVKAQADETPINIEKIIDFKEQLCITPREIRSSIQHLTWKEQMRKVINETFNTDHHE